MMIATQVKRFTQSRKRSRLGFLMAVSLFLLTTVGCGDNRGLRIPVSGTVSIEGKPVEFGSILFKASNDPSMRPGGGSLETGGTYAVSIYTAFDGLPPGNYDVAIIATEALGETAQRWHAPKKYSDTAISGLTAEISKSTKQIDFELSWKGEKKSAPFIEKF